MGSRLRRKSWALVRPSGIRQNSREESPASLNPSLPAGKVTPVRLLVRPAIGGVGCIAESTMININQAVTPAMHVYHAVRTGCALSFSNMTPLTVPDLEPRRRASSTAFDVNVPVVNSKPFSPCTVCPPPSPPTPEVLTVPGRKSGNPRSTPITVRAAAEGRSKRCLMTTGGRLEHYRRGELPAPRTSRGSPLNSPPPAGHWPGSTPTESGPTKSMPSTTGEAGPQPAREETIACWGRAGLRRPPCVIGVCQ